MATDQGRTSNLNGLQLVSNIENKIVPEVGHTQHLDHLSHQLQSGQ